VRQRKKRRERREEVAIFPSSSPTSPHSISWGRGKSTVVRGARGERERESSSPLLLRRKERLTVGDHRLPNREKKKDDGLSFTSSL